MLSPRKRDLAEEKNLHVWSVGLGKEGQLGVGAYTNLDKPKLIHELSVNPKKTIQVRALLKVACGHTHCLALTDEGDVFSWGSGRYFKLGHGDTLDQLVPTRIEYFVKSGIRIVDISAGEEHSIAVDENGHVYTWGLAREGQLGTGAKGHKCELPLRIKPAKFHGRKVVKVSSNSCFSCAVTEDGKIYSFGWGSHGRLGHGDHNECLFPTQIAALDNEFIVDVACGWRHACAITRDGRVYSWGANSYSQCGHGDNEEKSTPKLIEGLLEYKISQICCGERFSMALSDTGIVFCWGDGSFGQLGTEKYGTVSKPAYIEALMLQTDSIVHISAGATHAAAVSDKGEVFTWGRGTNGQLGHDLGSGEDTCFYPDKVEIGSPSWKFSKVYCGEDFTIFVSAHAPPIFVSASTYQRDFAKLFEKGSEEQRDVDVYVNDTLLLRLHSVLLIARSKLLRDLLTSHETEVTKSANESTTLQCTIVKSERVSITISCGEVEEASLMSFQQIVQKFFLYLYSSNVVIDKDAVSSFQSLAKLFEMDFLEKYLQQFAPSPFATQTPMTPQDEAQTSITRKKIRINHKEELQRSLVELLESQQCSDTKIKVGMLDTLQVHRCILAARSQHFHAMLDESGMKESNEGVVEFPENTLHCVRMVIRYLYTDEISFEAEQDPGTTQIQPEESAAGSIVFEVFRLTDEIVLERLKEICERYISENVTIENASDIKEIAEDCNSQQLSSFCNYFLTQLGPTQDLKSVQRRAYRPTFPTEAEETPAADSSSSTDEQQSKTTLSPTEFFVAQSNKIREALVKQRARFDELIGLDKEGKLRLLKRNKWISDKMNTLWRYAKKVLWSLLIIILYIPLCIILVIYAVIQRLQDRLIKFE